MIQIGDVLKRAWDIAWRYKILWVFGFFAAEASSGGASFNGNFNGGSSGSNGLTGLGSNGAAFFERWWPVLVGLVLFLILLGIVMWILSVAARGGIVRLTSDADEGLEVRAGHGWSTGFSKWGRVFLQQIVFFLPVLVIVLFFVSILVLVLGGSIAGIVSGARGGGSAGGAALAGGILGIVAGACGFFLVMFVVLFAIGLLYLVWIPLSLRYAIIFDRPAVKAIGDGWTLLRSRFRDVALTAVVLWAIGLVYGLVLLVLAFALLLPAVGLAFVRLWPVTVLLVLLFAAVVIVAGSVYNAFYSAAWTIAFRRITGLAPQAAFAVSPAEGPATNPGYLPEPPPAAGSAPYAAPPAPAPGDAEAGSAVGDLGDGLPSSLATQPAGSVDDTIQPPRTGD